MVYSHPPRRLKGLRIIRCAGILTLWLSLFPSVCVANLGPENVFVVVNSRSWSSWTIANHYTRLRRIPDVNVFALDWPGSVVSTDVDSFREQILRPILQEINRRRLAGQIRCIAYSSDFPYAIDFSAESSAKFSTGSITGMTYLYQQVLSTRRYTSANSNRYAETRLGSQPEEFSRFFETDRAHLLSVVLGYTSGRGNSVAEVIRCLTRSRFSDGTFPRGTVYLSQLADVRSRTRSGRFAAVSRALAGLHMPCETIQTKVPKGRQDVLGAVLGTLFFRWSRSNSRIMPGGICENLTSFGGILDDGGGQTPATELIRYGASGTCGTVVEPYALAAKFPDPSLHVAYRQGLTLAEAIYRSVRSPYQLLVLGDPLCSPMRAEGELLVDGVESGQSVTGRLTLRPYRQITNPQEEFVLLIDGRQMSACKPGQAFVIDTTQVPDGYHELRLVSRSPLGLPIARRIIPISVVNQDGTEVWTSVGPRRVRWGGALLGIELPRTAAAQTMAFHGRELVAAAQPNQRTLWIDTKRLGFGPAKIQTLAIPAGGPRHIFGQPIWKEVLPQQVMRGVPQLIGEVQPGFTLQAEGQPPTVIQSTKNPRWIEEAGIANKQPFELHASVKAAAGGLHQLQVLGSGAINVSMNGVPIARLQHQGIERADIPINLSKGRHDLSIRGRLYDNKQFEVRFGDRGGPRLGGKNSVVSP